MHINEMLNKKTYIGDIQPNPKEFGIWIKNDGSHMIYDYTNREWICNCGGSGNSVPKSHFTIAMEANTFTGSGGDHVEGAHYTYVIKEYEYELGMTFEQWTHSKYNIDGFAVDGEYFKADCVTNGESNIGIVMEDYVWITGDTEIQDMLLYNIDDENGGNVFANLCAFIPEG